MTRAKTAKEVEKLSRVVKTHRIDSNLYLVVRNGKKGLIVWWMYRTEIGGKKKSSKLGNYPDMTLQQARTRSIKLQAMKLDGLDPTEEIRKQREQAKKEAIEANKEIMTFEKAYMEFLEFKAGANGWKGGEIERKRAESVFRKHLNQILNKPVKELTAEILAQALKPVAESLPETYKKLTTRLHGFFTWCGTKGYRSIDLANPADKEILRNWINPPKNKEHHYGALTPEAVPLFFMMLRSKSGITARCVEFCLLTGIRSKTARFMTWKELDKGLTVWTVPPDKMKASSNGLHFVPLSKQARELLIEIKQMGLSNTLIFPSPVGDFKKPLSENAPNQFVKKFIDGCDEKAFIDPTQSLIQGKEVKATMHGSSRSTLATWATDNNIADKETIEAVLHHSQGKIQQAYFRSKKDEARRKLLQQWADHCYSLIEGNE